MKGMSLHNMKKNSYITVTDQFCGAGGSSQGVRKVSNKNGGGLEVKLALNHWQLAIDTHNTNFPDTMHDCTDVSASDPRRYPSTDILITSPECTNHSLAKGVKIAKKQIQMFTEGKLDPAAERSRATMWDVCRFAEFHNYNIIIVENVVDARMWVMFDSWLMAMHALGYNHKCVYINSMHCHPTPQSRDRMYVVFWKKGNKAPNLNFTPKAHCTKCNADISAVQCFKPNQKTNKYKTGYIYSCPVHGTEVEPYYYAAFNIIDWSDIGTRIGDRDKLGKRELSPNTIKRIEFGLKKFGGENFIFHNAYSNEARGIWRELDKPAFTQTTLSSQALALPFIVDDKQSTGVGFRTRSVSKPLNTVHTDPRVKLVVPPFIIKGEHTLKEGYVKNVFEASQTQTVRQSMGIVTPPMLIELNRTGKAKRLTEPNSTFTAGVVNQSIVTNESWNSFISYYYGKHQASNMTDPIGTASTKERHQLITYKSPKIDDCFYRMIKPAEVKLAMAFEGDYVVLGSGKDQVKQLGNAVTPPAMEWLVERCIESLK